MTKFFYRRRALFFKVHGAQLSLLITYLNERVPDLEDGTLSTHVHTLFVCHHFLGVEVGFLYEG
jgi:hypothetical protein